VSTVGDALCAARLDPYNAPVELIEHADHL
jgi:hypothetical protein